MNKAKVFFITQGTCKSVADFDQALAEVTKAIKSSEIKRGSNHTQREKKREKATGRTRKEKRIRD